VTETIEYKLTGEDRYCPDCGTKYKVVTKEVVKRLKFIPSTFDEYSCAAGRIIHFLGNLFLRTVQAGEIKGVRWRYRSCAQ